MANNNKHTGPNVPALRFPEFSGEWERYRLDECVTFLDEKRKPIKSSDRVSEKGLYPYYGASGIIDRIDNFIFDDDLVLLSEDGANILDRNYRVAFIVRGKAWINNHAHVLKPNCHTDIVFLSESLERIDYAPYNTGTTMPKLNQEVCRGIMLYMPTPTEQAKIGSLLKLVNERIEAQSKIIEDKETLYKAIIDKHFKEIRKNESIQEVYLSNVFKERVEYSSNDGVFPHASLTKEGVNIKTDRYNRDFLVKDTEKQYKVTRINDICYNPANLKFGVITRNKVGTLIFSPIYVTFEVRNGYDPAYIELMVTNSDFVNKMLRFQEGTVYERMAVSSEDFLSESCKIPDLEIQKEFSAHVSIIEQSIQVEKKYLESICRIKNFILEAMFI